MDKQNNPFSLKNLILQCKTSKCIENLIGSGLILNKLDDSEIIDIFKKSNNLDVLRSMLNSPGFHRDHPLWEELLCNIAKEKADLILDSINYSMKGFDEDVINEFLDKCEDDKKIKDFFEFGIDLEKAFVGIFNLGKSHFLPYLLERGAELSKLKDYSVKKILESNIDESEINLLLNAGLNKNLVLLHAYSKNKKDLIQEVKSKGASLDQVDTWDITKCIQEMKYYDSSTRVEVFTYLKKLNSLQLKSILDHDNSFNVDSMTEEGVKPAHLLLYAFSRNNLSLIIKILMRKIWRYG